MENKPDQSSSNGGRRHYDHINKEIASSIQENDVRINRLEASADGLAGEVDNLNTDLKMLAQVVRENSKTNWNVLAAWAGVIMMLVIALGNGYVATPMGELREDLDNTTNQLNQYIQTDGPPQTLLNRIAQIESDLKEMDEEHHTHVDEIVRTIEKNIEMQRTSVETEIVLRNKNFQNRLDILQQEIDRLRQWEYDVNKSHMDAQLQKRGG